MSVQHIVNVSGGKDSTACYILAVRRGRPFRAVFADTGNEHPETLDYLHSLPALVGGPAIETVRRDFSGDFERRRTFIADKWPEQGVDAATVERALAIMRPSGNPFLDLCMLKGRFPSRRAQFCTGELKARPIEAQVMVPALAFGAVVRWSGERRDESEVRKGYPRFQRVRWHAPASTLIVFRPLVEWTAAQVFALHADHGVAPNPLYRQGMGRVGCMPCINCSKNELREIARRFPEQIERIAEWERIVASVSKRGAATFFPAPMTPQGREAIVASKRGDEVTFPNIADAVAWSQTDHGGRQLSLVTALESDTAPMCASQYGLCE